MHQLSSLQPKTNYQIRVCAIRICRDNSEGLIGPYSPSTLFTTSGSKPLPTATNESVAVKTTTKLTSFQLSDSQWAFLILLGFTLCAVILAFGAKHIIERTNNAVTSRSWNQFSTQRLSPRKDCVCTSLLLLELCFGECIF